MAVVDQRRHLVPFLRGGTSLRNELATIDRSRCGANSFAAVLDHGQLVPRNVTDRMDFGHQLPTGTLAGPTQRWVKGMDAGARCI